MKMSILQSVRFAFVFVFILAIAAHRAPAPVIEPPEATPTPSVAPKAPEETSAPKPKHKKVESEPVAKKEPQPRTKAAAKPTAASKGFAGTWKGKMADGANWTVVVDLTETKATAYGPRGAESGPARVQENRLLWSHIGARQRNDWSMTLQPGGRRAEFTAFHVSGNISGVLDRTD